MNDELEQIDDAQMIKDAESLLIKVGEILDDNHMLVVHLVLGRLFVGLSLELSQNKESYMELCSNTWDQMNEDRAEETKH